MKEYAWTRNPDFVLFWAHSRNFRRCAQKWDFFVRFLKQLGLGSLLNMACTAHYSFHMDNHAGLPFSFNPWPRFVHKNTSLESERKKKLVLYFQQKYIRMKNLPN